jgi:SAM-dependent methyltransferase
MFKSLAQSVYENASTGNRSNIINLAASVSAKNPSILDLGCDDGHFTTQLSLAVGARKVSGVEIIAERGSLAQEKGIEVWLGDMMNGISFPDNEFDLVHANQVIEHVSNVDFFVSEIYRLLRPGGIAIISTENGSSWCNIFAAVMGWQQFSLTNVSSLQNGVGNPLALHQGETAGLSSWTHKTIFNYRGLIEFFAVHKLEIVKCVGAGYFPLPWRLGLLDARHAHFLTLAVMKKK